MSDGGQNYWFISAGGLGAVGLGALNNGLPHWVSAPMIVCYLFLGIAVGAFVCGVQGVRYPLLRPHQPESAVPEAQPAARSARSDDAELTAASGRRMGRVRRALLISAFAVVGLIGFVIGTHVTSAPSTPPVASLDPYSFRPQYVDGLVVVRHWKLSGQHGSLLSETLTVRSVTGKALHATFIEPLPAAIASNIRTARFTPTRAKIVDSGHAVEWKLNVPKQSTVVRYRIAVPPVGTARFRMTQWAKGITSRTAVLNPARLQLLRIGPRPARVVVGRTARLKLTGLLSNRKDAPENALAGAVWKSENRKVAIVSSSGRVTGRRLGRVHVTVRVGAIRQSILVTVTSPIVPSPGVGTTPGQGPQPSQIPTPHPSSSPTPTITPSTPG